MSISSGHSEKQRKTSDWDIECENYENESGKINLKNIKTSIENNLSKYLANEIKDKIIDNILNNIYEINDS